MASVRHPDTSTDKMVPVVRMTVAIWDRDFDPLMNDIKTQENNVKREVDVASLQSTKASQSDGLQTPLIPNCTFTTDKQISGRLVQKKLVKLLDILEEPIRRMDFRVRDLCEHLEGELRGEDFEKPPLITPRLKTKGNLEMDIQFTLHESA